MGDVKVLLHEAVPVDDIEPDFGFVAGRVRQRRRRRTTGRLAAVVGVVALLGGATVAGSGLLGPDDGDDTAVVAGPEADPTTTTGPPTSASSTFARLLAERPWLAEADLDGWPVQPSELISGPPEPGVVAIGTVVEVRPGPVTTAFCHGVPKCVAQTNVEVVVRVDLALPGAPEHPDQVVVPWVTEQYTDDDPLPDQATSDRNARPFVAAAPIGARVLVLMSPTHRNGDPFDGRPLEPSGIALEAPDGVAVPQPDAGAPDLTMSFDDFAAEVGRRLPDRFR